MASTHSAFSVFPPSAPVPRISLPNPHNRKPSLTKEILATTDVRGSDGTCRDEPPVPKIPAKHLPKQNVRCTPSPDGARTLVNESPEPPPRIKDMDSPEATQSRSNYESPDTFSPETARTLGSGVAAIAGRKSPLVQMRSMFPVYNPNVPLAEQQYYPQRPSQTYVPSIPMSKYSSRPEIRSQMASPIDREVGVRTAPQSLADIPLDVLSIKEARYSSPKTLDELWDATHGTEPNGVVGKFDLEMARISDATFTFGSKPDLPFYTVTTYDTNEISVAKTCPRKRTLTCDVALTSLEPVERRMPPNDGLITFLFPKMAAMLAINQSAAIAEQHRLAPTHRDEVQAAAMRRAADQEASYLRYNHLFRRYELEHPAIARKQRDPNFVMSPASATEHIQPVLHLNVHSTLGRTSHGKPNITVTFPTVRNGESAGEGVRLSTIGQSETDPPLASLDFHSNTLHVDANHILELMPSLFAIDSIVTAILAVAVADRTTNIVMGSMEIWSTPPRSLASPAGSAMTWGHQSTIYATLAEREEAEAEARAMEQVHKKDVKSSKKVPGKAQKSNKTWYGREKAPKKKEEKKKKKKKKQILMGEFDLEKLSHYQSGSREGQELPGITRAIVSVLIGGLKFIVWILTAIVQTLVWILVRATRCVTSEKF